MDGETSSRRPVLALIAAAALVVGLAVFGVLALSGDDDPGSPTSGPRPTSGLAPVTTRATPVTGPEGGPATSTTAVGVEVSTPPAAATGDGSAPPVAGPGYDSEACSMFRDLLQMVDDAALRAAAAQVGCI